jgi:hypothetical protein
MASLAQPFDIEWFALCLALGAFTAAMIVAFLRTRRRAFLAALFAPLAPLAVVAGFTAYQYFTGTIRIPGFPSGTTFRSEMGNLDPEYRIDCERDESPGVLARTRMRTLEFMVSWLGPVPGSYQGPYPDRQMAWAAVRSAHVFLEPTALAHTIAVDGQSFQLPPTDVQRVLRWTAPTEYEPNPTVALKVFEGTCLLIGHASGETYQVEMFDTSRLGWFARYVYPADANIL